MNTVLLDSINHIVKALPDPALYGTVLRSVGLTVEVLSPSAFIGEQCEIFSGSDTSSFIRAEVIGFDKNTATIMPFGSSIGVKQGDKVKFTNRCASTLVSEQLVGRIVNAFSQPIDGKGSIKNSIPKQYKREAISPLIRKPIKAPLKTGIKVIDNCITLGKGQRIGLMAGSGVGKSVLLSSICKHVNADVNVVALIGERGREVEEFVTETLGEEGLKKSVVIVSTAEDSPLQRIQAAYSAVTIAEYFSSQGKDVLFTMDSITRFATSLREIGLARGEPPTVRGFTPSVFSILPNLIEKGGNFKNGGSISAIFTVLVESDDFNDPVVDCVRAVLDGHIVLSRDLAKQGHFPAIDMSTSVSRLSRALQSEEHQKLSERCKKVFGDYQQNREVLELGLFDEGNSQNRKNLVSQYEALASFVKQGANESFSEQQSVELFESLEAII